MAAAVASVSLRCGGVKAFLPGEDRAAGGDRAREGPRLPRPHATRRCAARAVLATAGQQKASTSVCVGPVGPRRAIGGADHHQRRGGTDREAVPPEKLDEWMRDSVAEIVRSIGEAPFLVHVFSGGEGTAGLKLQREAADAESWPHIRRRWSTGAGLPPDGVILVEELKEGEEDGREGEATGSDDKDACCSSSDRSAASSSSKTWGLVVQGRGTDGAACYILNTCRVRSSFGFCTHFCLARAKCFGDTADVQLKNAWLLGWRHQQQQQQQ